MVIGIGLSENCLFLCSFQKAGIETNLGMGKLNEFERALLEAAMPELIKSIKKGEEFAKKE